MKTQILNYILYCFLFVNLFACKEGSLQQVVEVEIPEHEPKIALAMELNQGDELLS